MISFPVEVEKQLAVFAAQKGLATEAYLLSLVQKETGAQVAFEQARRADDHDSEALNHAVAALLNRTPAQKRAARESAIQESQPKITLPTNVSPFDVMPVVRGHETDEEVLQALKELS